MSRLVAIRPKRPISATQSFAGTLGLSGSVIPLVTVEPPAVRSLTLVSQLFLTATLDGLKSGPDLVTVEGFTAGELIPTGDVSSVVGGSPVPVDPVTLLVDAVIALSGTVAGAVSGPSLETKPKSLSANLAPTGQVVGEIVPTEATLTESVAGSITPAGAVTGLQSGPSFETKFKNVTGSLAPVGTKTDVVIPPPTTFFSEDVVGVITPTGTLSHLTSGPSLETKPKSIFGTLILVGSVAGDVSGPSFVTKTKTVQGNLAPSGTVARQITNNPTILTKSVTGAISPVGSLTSDVQAGTPQVSNPLYTSMGSWDVDEYDNHPQWPAVTFTAIFGNTTTADIKAMLDAMAARGMKGGPSTINPGSMGDKQADGSWKFNMTKFQSLIDKIAAVSGIAGYIGTTFTMMCVGDELHHPKWNGTIPPNTRKQMLQYVRQKLPGVLTSFRMPYEKLSGSELPTGGWGGTLDMGWAQYSGPKRHGDPLSYFQDQLTKLATIGVAGLVTGGNWWNGGDGSSGIPGPDDTTANDLWVMSPQEIRAVVDAAIQISLSTYFMYWTDAHNSNLGAAAMMQQLQDSQPYKDAFAYAKSAGLARGGTPQPKEYFVDSGFYAAPPTPPGISLGTAVRDDLTGHKVFRLVDGARTQAAELPALNADNSIIYYIKGSTGYIADLIWKLSSSEVQVTNERIASGTGPANINDAWVWDRSNPRYAYHPEAGAIARIYRRDTRLNTSVLMKDLNLDPSFLAYWTTRGQSGMRLGSGLHTNRTQEKFCGIVRDANRNPIGAFVWDRNTSALWNYQQPSGKTVERVQLDDPGLYVVIKFTDGTWQVGRLDSPNGLMTLSIVQSNAPTEFDIGNLDGKQLAFVGDGIGLRTWDVDPVSANAAILYSHPQRSNKQNLYNKGKLSLQSFNDLAVYMTYYDAAISTAWQLHSGSIYKLNWASELAANSYKIVPEVVRQGSQELTKVPSLSTLTAPGQWFYNSNQQTLYVRTTDSTNPSTKKMVVFDWRFGMEEILLVTTTGTLIGRLCRHFSHIGDADGVDADACRGPQMSYDGSRVVFASNRGGGTVGIYCVLTDPND